MTAPTARSRVATFAHESVLGFVVSTVMLPATIAVLTALLYVASSGNGEWYHAVNRSPTRVCFFAVVFALLFCGLLGVTVCRRYVRASSACPGVFTDIQQEYVHVDERVSVACAANAPDTLALCKEAKQHCAYLERLVANPREAGIPWLLATGYLDAQRRLHAVEDLLILLDPVPLVVRESLNDEMRLVGSTVPQNAALLKRLRLALVTLDSGASQYLAEAPVPAPEPPVGDAAAAAADARAALAQVRSAIAEFRDGRREGLVRARNRLFGTVVFEGITGCVLLFVAILSGAPPSAVVAAAAFYLVGAVVGLVKQLQTAGAADGASQEDYGLGVVRLVQTPLLSGLAAIGGVVLVQLGQTQSNAFSLSNTFDLHQNPYGLVAAAFFGLAPSVLLSSLQQRFDSYRSDLSKSEASGAGAAQGSTPK